MIQDGPSETQDLLNLWVIRLCEPHGGCAFPAALCSLAAAPAYLFANAAAERWQRCSSVPPFLPETVCEAGKRRNTCNGFASPPAWWPYSSWNGDPGMTCSHRGTEHGEVRCILALIAAFTVSSRSWNSVRASESPPPLLISAHYKINDIEIFPIST